MKLVTFAIGASEDSTARRLGLVRDTDVLDLTAAWGFLLNTQAVAPRSVRELIDQGPESLATVADIADRVDRAQFAIPAEHIRLLAPVEIPPKLICAGLNYRPLAERVRFRRGEGHPLFLKATSTITGPDSPVLLPADVVGPVMAEVELAVVIGRPAKHVSVEQALSYVFGYTILLDITAQEMMERDAYTFQPPGAGGQADVRHIVMFRSKHYDTFTPMGPYIVTADEIDRGSLASLPIEAEIDGEPVVRGNTGDMLVDVPELISYVSSVMSLMPGDVIATGHPGNVVDRPLAPGQRVQARIGGIGTLTVSVEKAQGGLDGS